MIRAYQGQAALTMDVHGPATMTESPAVHALASEHVARGVRRLRFDLRACTMMDSTFSGTLLSLKRQLDRVSGDLSLVVPSTRVLELLCEMGLEDFYRIEVADPPTGPSVEVSPEKPGIDALQRRILDAHEELERVPGEASRKFGPVVDQLKRPHLN